MDGHREGRRGYRVFSKKKQKEAEGEKVRGRNPAERQKGAGGPAFRHGERPKRGERAPQARGSVVCNQEKKKSQGERKRSVEKRPNEHLIGKAKTKKENEKKNKNFRSLGKEVLANGLQGGAGSRGGKETDNTTKPNEGQQAKKS